jgi:putative LysE/RhtB family amino acid efflux pump
LDFSALSSYHWLAGVLIGVLAAAPIGPVNILIIERTLRVGQRSALWLGLSGAVGDALFAAAAAFGLSAIRLAFDVHQSALRIGGALFMIGFALLLWRQAPHLQGAVRKPAATGHMALAVLMMTLTNPATILWFVAAFAMFRFQGVGPESQSAIMGAALLIFGVFCGSMLWWIGISAMAKKLRGRLTDAHLLWLNHGCALLLLGFGVFAAVTAY